MKVVCEFALENVMKKFSEGGPLDPPYLQKLSMRVPINHKKLYYNYYTYNPPTAPPKCQMLCYIPDGCIQNRFQF
jgi:hypothetical protein